MTLRSSERLRRHPAGVTTLALVVIAGGLALAGVSPAGVIAIPVGIAVAVLSVVRPVAGLFCLIALRPLVDSSLHKPIAWASWSVTLATAWGAALIVVLVVFIGRAHPSRRDVIGYLVPIALIVGYSATTFWRAGSGTAFTNCSRLASAILLMFAIELIAREAEGQAAVVLVVALTACLLIVVVGIAIMRDVYGGGYYYAKDGSFDFGTNQAPYAYAVIAVLMLPFVFGGVLAGARRLLPATIAALLVAVVVMSFSRTAYLALAVLVTAFLALLALARYWKVVGAVALAVVAGAVGTSVMFPDVITNRFLHGGQRLVIWRPLVDSVLDKPERILFGGGTQFSSAATGYYPHNDFLATFASGGVLLLGLYLLFLLWIAWSLAALTRASNTRSVRGFGLVLLGALGAAIVPSTFDGFVFSVMMLTLAVLVGLARGMQASPNETFIDRRLFAPSPAPEPETNGAT